MTEPISPELLGLSEEPERATLERAWDELSLIDNNDRTKILGPLQQHSLKLQRIATTLLNAHKTLRGEKGGQVRDGDNYIRMFQNPGERSLQVRKWNNEGENIMCTFVITEQSLDNADEIRIETQDENPIRLKAMLKKEKLQKLTRKEVGKEPQILDFEQSWKTEQPDLQGFEV